MTIYGDYISTKIKHYDGCAPYVMVRTAGKVRIYKKDHKCYKRVSLPNHFFFRANGLWVNYNCGDVQVNGYQNYNYSCY